LGQVYFVHLTMKPRPAAAVLESPWLPGDAHMDASEDDDEEAS